jgi:hypothetical protein
VEVKDTSHLSEQTLKWLDMIMVSVNPLVEMNIKYYKMWLLLPRMKKCKPMTTSYVSINASPSIAIIKVLTLQSFEVKIKGCKIFQMGVATTLLVPSYVKIATHYQACKLIPGTLFCIFPLSRTLTESNRHGKFTKRFFHRKEQC